MSPLPQQPRALQRSREAGQAMVEFALIAPILFLLLFCVFQFGVLYLKYEQVGFAASEGARCAAVARDGNRPACAFMANSPEEAAVTRAISKAPHLDLTEDDIAVSSNSGYAVPGRVTVTVTHDVEVPIIGTTYELRASSTAKLEN